MKKCIVDKVPQNKIWELYCRLNTNYHIECPYTINEMKEHICRVNLAMVKMHYEATGDKRKEKKYNDTIKLIESFIKE